MLDSALCHVWLFIVLFAVQLAVPFIAHSSFYVMTCLIRFLRPFRYQPSRCQSQIRRSCLRQRCVLFRVFFSHSHRNRRCSKSLLSISCHKNYLSLLDASSQVKKSRTGTATSISAVTTAPKSSFLRIQPLYVCHIFCVFRSIFSSFFIVLVLLFLFLFRLLICEKRMRYRVLLSIFVAFVYLRDANHFLFSLGPELVASGFFSPSLRQTISGEMHHLIMAFFSSSFCLFKHPPPHRRPFRRPRLSSCSCYVPSLLDLSFFLLALLVCSLCSLVTLLSYIPYPVA